MSDEISNVRRILASNPKTAREEHDFYATDPIAIDSLIKLVGGETQRAIARVCLWQRSFKQKTKRVWIRSAKYGFNR